MGKRGPTPAIELVTPLMFNERRCLQAPAELSAAEKAEFERVARGPAREFLTADQTPLVAAYAALSVRMFELVAERRRDEEFRRTVAALVAVARSLRITAHARVHKDRAGRAALDDDGRRPDAKALWTR